MNGALWNAFFSLRPDDLGDHGLLGGRLGALQALQVSPDLLHHLLQLHDPRTLRGATQVLVIFLIFLNFWFFFPELSLSLCPWPAPPTGEASPDRWSDTRENHHESWLIRLSFLVCLNYISPASWEDMRHSSEDALLLWLFCIYYICRFILTAWLLSLVPSVPNLFIFTTTGEAGAQECVSDFSEWNDVAKKGYFTAVFLVIFVIPLVSFPEYFDSSAVFQLMTSIHTDHISDSRNDQSPASLCISLLYFQSILSCMI